MESSTLKRHNSLRMQGYDYNDPGIYFITIATKPRRNLFWDDITTINNPQEALNEFGIILKNMISRVETRIKDVEVINSIVMPDLLHLLIKIENDDYSISQVVRWIKSQSSLMIRKNQPNLEVWQRSFYDHIIRDQHELDQCNSYIEENPNNWRLGKEENNPF